MSKIEVLEKRKQELHAELTNLQHYRNQLNERRSYEEKRKELYSRFKSVQDSTARDNIAKDIRELHGKNKQLQQACSDFENKDKRYKPEYFGTDSAITHCDSVIRDVEKQIKDNQQELQLAIAEEENAKNTDPDILLAEITRLKQENARLEEKLEKSIHAADATSAWLEKFIPLENEIHKMLIKIERLKATFGDFKLPLEAKELLMEVPPALEVIAHLRSQLLPENQSLADVMPGAEALRSPAEPTSSNNPRITMTHHYWNHRRKCEIANGDTATQAAQKHGLTIKVPSPK